MIEVNLKYSPNLIKDTLSRIGVPARTKNVLFPSVYLWTSAENKFFLIHFKEYFMIRDPKGSYNNISKEDQLRLSYIAGRLLEWELLDCDASLTIPKPPAKTIVLKKEMIVNGTWKIQHKIPI